MTFALKEFTGIPLHSDIEKYIAELNIPKSSKILDIGCGSGAWLDRLSKLGFSNLTGIDREKEKFQAKNVNFFNFDINSSNRELISEKFDLITSIEVLEHIANPFGFFELISKSLSDSGVCILSTPNIHSLLCRMRFFFTGQLKGFDSKHEPTHLFPVHIDSIKKILTAQGLFIREIRPLPEKKLSLTSKPLTILLAKFFRLFLSDPLPGDFLLIEIRRSPK